MILCILNKVNTPMIERLHERRFTVFLISFLITLFGNLLFPYDVHQKVEMVLLSQNMLFSILLFMRQSYIEKGLITIVALLAIISGFNQYYMEQNMPVIFTGIYVLYFAMISFRLFFDITHQKVVSVETISGVFCGFILLGFMSSILFITLDTSPGAFASSTDSRTFSDFVYFSFITLLTIGYGDITPTMVMSKKVVVLVGLLGHFYTVFVTAIIIGKYLGQSKQAK